MKGFKWNLVLFHEIYYKIIDGSKVFEDIKDFWFISGVGHPFTRQLKNSLKTVLVNYNFHSSHRWFQIGHTSFKFRYKSFTKFGKILSGIWVKSFLREAWEIYWWGLWLLMRLDSKYHGWMTFLARMVNFSSYFWFIKLANNAFALGVCLCLWLEEAMVILMAE